MFSDSENECDEMNFDEGFLKSLLSFIDESEELPDMQNRNQLSFSSGYSSESNQLDSVVPAVYNGCVSSAQPKEVVAQSPQKTFKHPDMSVTPFQTKLENVSLYQDDRRVVLQGHKRDFIPVVQEKNLLSIHCLENVFITDEPCRKSYVSSDFQANINSNPLFISPKVPSSDPRTSRLSVHTSENRNDRNSMLQPLQICRFCLKNGEPEVVYLGHFLKTFHGIITCPILRRYVCELCGATGSSAHTRKYCPLNPEPFEEIPQFRKLTNGLLTTSLCHK